ncbi:MAG: hypothetical protein Kow0025_12290 [Thermodesulfovibrionales bacterium]
MKSVLSIFFALCLVAAASAGDEGGPPPGYDGPVAERPQFARGDRWEYRWRGQIFFTAFDRAEGGQLRFTARWRGGAGWEEYKTPDLNFVKAIVKGGAEVKEECRPYRGPLSFPLWVGKKWEYSFQVVEAQSAAKVERPGGPGQAALRESSVEVVGYEQVEVPAGTFWAFRIEEVRSSREGRGMARYRLTFWYSPEVRNFVKVEEEKEAWNRVLTGYAPAAPAPD